MKSLKVHLITEKHRKRLLRSILNVATGNPIRGMTKKYFSSKSVVIIEILKMITIKLKNIFFIGK
jgi:hypothetical protein